MAYLINVYFKYLDRYKRQSSVYDSIAQATGGEVARFSSSQELADKVEEDLMVI